MSQIQDSLWRAKLLVNEFPTDAAEFIARHCDHGELVTTIQMCQARDSDYAPHGHAGTYSANHASSAVQQRRRAKAPSVSSRDEPGSPLRAQGMPPSPALTNSSSSKRRLSGESFEFAALMNGRLCLKPLSVLRLPISHNLIRHDLVVKRLGFAEEIVVCDTLSEHITVSHKDLPYGTLDADSFAVLNYRKNGGCFHEETFYIVPDLQDVDVVLRTGMSSAQERGVDEAVVASPIPQRHARGLPTITQLNELDTRSFHSSSNTGSASTVRPGHPLKYIPMPNQANFAQGRHDPRPAPPFGVSEAAPQSSSQSATSRSSVIEEESDINYWRSGVPSSQTKGSMESTIVRVKFEWGDDSKNGNLDLNSPPEHFIQILDRVFTQSFERELDRSGATATITFHLAGGKKRRQNLDLDDRSLLADWSDITEELKSIKLDHTKRVRIVINGG